MNLSFTNFHKQLPVPYVIYADFEAFNEKIEPIQSQSTTKTGKHTVNSYGYGYSYGDGTRCCPKVFSDAGGRENDLGAAEGDSTLEGDTLRV